MLAAVLGVVPMSGAPETVPDVVLELVPGAPMAVPLPVLPVDDAVSVELLPVDAVELLVVSLVDGVVGMLGVVATLGLVDDVSAAALSALRSPQAASDRAATSARAAQRAIGVAFIGTLL